MGFPFFNRKRSSEEILAEAERLFGGNPSIEEAARHLDRELSRKYAPQFDLIRQASGEIQRRIEAGEVDRQAGEAAKAQMALQVAQAFKAEKAELLHGFEEGLRHFGRGEWEAAFAAFSRTASGLPLPPIHLALANTAAHIDAASPGSPDPGVHYEAALETFRTFPKEKPGLGTALVQAALFHRKRGNPDRGLPLLRESLDLFKNLGDREKTCLVKDLIRLF